MHADCVLVKLQSSRALRIQICVSIAQHGEIDGWCMHCEINLHQQVCCNSALYKHYDTRSVRSTGELELRKNGQLKIYPPDRSFAALSAKRSGLRAVQYQICLLCTFRYNLPPPFQQGTSMLRATSQSIGVRNARLRQIE